MQEAWSNERIPRSFHANADKMQKKLLYGVSTWKI